MLTLTKAQVRRTISSNVIALSTIVFGTFLVWSIEYVPPNMDEFSSVHPLACLYPYSYLHTFREGCTEYLIDYGYFSYYRSYKYIGITSSLLYFPLWLIWKSPYSFYLHGLMFLIAFSLTSVKSLRLPYKYAIIPLCYFPIAYSFIHDTGPVRLALLSIPLISLVISKLLDDKTKIHNLYHGLLGGALIILCVEDKPFYLYMLPGIVMMSLGLNIYANPRLRILHAMARNRLPIIGLTVFLLVALEFLLFAGIVDGKTYFNFLRAEAGNGTTSFFSQARLIMFYAFCFPMYGHRVFEIGPSMISIVFWIFTALVFSLLLYLSLRRSRTFRKRVAAVFGLALILDVAILLATRNTWAGHHYIFLQVPILATLIVLAKGNVASFKLVVGFVLITNIASMAILTVSEIDPRSARERTEIFHYLGKHEIAKSNVINFSSWGGYHNQSLYGDHSQLVTYIEPLDQNGGAQLLKLAKSTSRQVINVCRDCDVNLMATLFGTHDIIEIKLGLKWWKIFQVSQPNIPLG